MRSLVQELRAEKKQTTKEMDDMFRHKFKSTAPTSTSREAGTEQLDRAPEDSQTSSGGQPISALEKAFNQVADIISDWFFKLLALFTKTPVRSSQD